RAAPARTEVAPRAVVPPRGRAAAPPRPVNAPAGPRRGPRTRPGTPAPTGALRPGSTARRWAATGAARSTTGRSTWRGSPDEHSPRGHPRAPRAARPDPRRARAPLAVRHRGSGRTPGHHLRAGDGRAGRAVAEPGRRAAVHRRRRGHPRTRGERMNPEDRARMQGDPHGDPLAVVLYRLQQIEKRMDNLLTAELY